MSDSRLEKFIYALCSMDVSDLPVPLSRIEKLWNCLITGETPDFEPLSRNEKYLMAMLDRYDISNLPAPMSRGEKLLYKIVVGETDLSDVPGYLSRYEELLKYLIENGGISGGDFEYVLYTLNQSLYTLYATAEKPVKSAILKGNTERLPKLNKTFRQGSYGGLFDEVSASNRISYNGVLNGYSTFKIKCVSGWECCLRHGNDVSWSNEIDISDSTISRFVLIFRKSDDSGIDLNSLYYEDVIESTNISELGEASKLVSVKMPVLTTTGKNLFNGGIVQGSVSTDNGVTITTDSAIRSDDYIELIGGETYTISKTKGTKTIAIVIYDENKKFVRPVWDKTFTLNTNEKYIKFADSENDLTNPYQIEKGVNSSSYEPYKSNILTVNEDVTLRGIGDVQDTLDLLTGEKVERISKIVLDGSEETWDNNYETTNTMTFKLPLPNKYFYIDQWVNTGLKNDCGFEQVGWFYIYSDQVDKECYGVGDNNNIYIRVLKSRLNSVDVNGFRSFLSTNPITIQYVLATESIKTVDLTVVDQDNQPTELGTFENVTHVSLEAENLIPEVEMEVATNLLEDTVFNLTDAFNTLYPTAAKPVKSAILKGQTLVNMVETTPISKHPTYTDFELTFVDKTKYYFIKFECSMIVNEIGFIVSNSMWNIKKMVNTETGYVKLKPDETKDITALRIRTNGNTESTIPTIKILCVEYQDGMENWDIPYFEGMQSVKMPVLTTTGSNMVNPTDIEVIGCNSYDVDSDGIANIVGDTTGYWARSYIRYAHHLKANTTYYIYCDGDSTGTIHPQEWIDNINTGRFSWSKFYSYTPKADVLYEVRIFLSADESPFTCSKIRIGIFESTTKPSSFESYKSNILTTNEEVELRGVGDVQDELNLLTGEMTERIEEVVLDGSEDWIKQHYTTGYTMFRYIVPNLPTNTSIRIGRMLCDKFNVENYINTNAQTREFITIRNGTTGQLLLNVSNEKANEVAVLKEWLSQNPITIQYQLAENVIKTVDLTIQDQNGNETKLGTFDDTTHVLLNSEGLVPEATLTVRTKIPSASSTSLLMDDILTKQEQLNTTVDEQSNNVDATMIATTEIFEEIL